MKRGFKTSEAQLTIIVIAGQLIAALTDVLPAGYAGIGATAAAIAYSLSRGLAKHGGAEAFPALVDAIESGDPHNPPSSP